MNIQLEIMPIETLELIKSLIGMKSTVATDMSALSGVLPNELKIPLKCLFSFGANKVINKFFDVFQNKNSFFSSKIQSIIKKNDIEIEIGKIDIQTKDSNSFITGVSVEITGINYPQVIKKLLPVALNAIPDEKNAEINGILKIIDDEKDKIIDFILNTVSDEKKEKIIIQLINGLQDKILYTINDITDKNGIHIVATKLAVS